MYLSNHYAVQVKGCEAYYLEEEEEMNEKDE